MLGVFTHEIVLYLLCADAPSPVSLIRVSLLLCRANKRGVQLPGYHLLDHCIEILSHDKDYTNVKLYEYSVAHSGLPRQSK